MDRVSVPVVVTCTSAYTTLTSETLTAARNLPKSFLGVRIPERGLRQLLAFAIARKLNVTV